MRRTYQRRSGLFLIELIINIAFFAVTSCICVQFFADSKIRAEENRFQSQAELMMDNIYAAVTSLDEEYLEIWENTQDQEAEANVQKAQDSQEAEANVPKTQNSYHLAQSPEGKAYLSKLNKLLSGSYIGEDGDLYVEQKTYYIKTHLSLEEGQILVIFSQGYRYGEEETFINRKSYHHIPYRMPER